MRIWNGPEGMGWLGKPKRERPVAKGACPECSNENVGLVRTSDAVHLVWQMHDLITHAGTHLPCASGGQCVCDHPARQIEGYVTPHCLHES